MDEITIGDKVYISSKRAAKITGYAKDYVGQLCREGRVEARLVGRNWYVLESAIREHRFGSAHESSNVAASSEEVPVEDRANTWQKPTYIPENPLMVPELAQKPVQEPVSSPAIADMQSAWREWFSDKKTVDALPDGSEDFKDEYLPVVLESAEPVEIREEETVTLQRIESPVEAKKPESSEESEVEIHKSYASRETGELVPHTSIPVVDLTPKSQGRSRPVKPLNPAATAKKPSGSGVTRALLIVLASVAVLVAVVGTGNADRYIGTTSTDSGPQKAILDFLGGKSSYKSTL
ncbi:MAG TPA: hypothetical protein VGE53_03515 [Candidatus Paceibacterota bacterium]